MTRRQKLQAGAAGAAAATVLAVGGVLLSTNDSTDTATAVPGCDTTALIESAKAELLLTTQTGKWFSTHRTQAGHWLNAFNLLDQAEACAQPPPPPPAPAPPPAPPPPAAPPPPPPPPVGPPPPPPPPVSQGSNLPPIHAPSVAQNWYVNGVTGSDTSGDGSAGNPWKTAQKASDYLAITAAWPASGDVAVNLRPAGYTFKDTTGSAYTLWQHFTNSARGPNANRWVVWRGDQGRVTIENPDTSTQDSIGVFMDNSAFNNYTMFDNIIFSGGGVPKGVAGHNGGTIGLYTLGNNNHHILVQNFEFWGFKQTGAANGGFESSEGVFQSGTAGPLQFVNGTIHDMGTVGSSAGGVHGLYLHGESGILILNVLAYNMFHGFAWQFYNSNGGSPGGGSVVSHVTLVDCGIANPLHNGGTYLIMETAAHAKVANSVLAFNGEAPALHFIPGTPGTGSNADHLVFYGNTGHPPDHDTSTGWTFTNIRTGLNPLFVNRPADNYRVGAGSPAIGYTDTTYSPAYDLDGIPRPAGAEDAGAYEFTSGPTGAVALTGAGSSTAAGAGADVGASHLAGAGVLAADSAGVRFGVSHLSGTGTSTVAGRRNRRGATAMAGVGLSITAGTRTRVAAVNLSGSGLLVPEAAGAWSGVAPLAGAGVLAAAGDWLSMGATRLFGTGLLTTTATGSVRGRHGHIDHPEPGHTGHGGVGHLAHTGRG